MARNPRPFRFSVFTIAIFVLVFSYISNISGTSVVNAKANPNARRFAVQLFDSLSHKPLSDGDATEIAKRDGFVNLGQIGGLEGYFLFQVADDSTEDTGGEKKLRKRSTEEIHDTLYSNLEYRWFELQQRKERVKRDFLDMKKSEENYEINIHGHQTEDSYGVLRKRDHLDYLTYFTDPEWVFQWHLHGRFSGKHEESINVIPLWKRGINGSGIHISIIDDGIEGTHPDLADNFAADLSFNFLERNSDIMPRTKEDNHGTRCAGEIASKPNNTVCGVGVAYGAIISGERLIGDIAPDDADEAAAFNHHYQIHEIYSQSWGPKDDGATVDKPGPLATKALQEGVERGRNGRGSLFVFASGNGGKHKDNCNYDGYANSINTITIGSTKSDGTSSTFAEICAAQLAVTFGGGSPNYISTTDINGGCTRQHQGTSAAAPIAAGILALVLQVRPDLSWRDIHHLLVTSAFRNDIHHPDWTKNGAGLFVNHMYGFGMIDAEILVNNSVTFKSVPSPALTYSTPLNWIRRSIPIDNQPIEERVVVTESDTGTLSTLEHVQVKVMIKHPNRGNLTIALVSPSNTTSLLGTVRAADTSTDGLPDWTFMTVRHWNERVHGTWKLVLTDSRSSNDSGNGASVEQGVLQAWSITFHGLCDEQDEYISPETKKLTCKTGISNRPKRELNDPLMFAIGFLIFAVPVVAIISVKLVKQYRLRKSQQGGSSSSGGKGNGTDQVKLLDGNQASNLSMYSLKSIQADESHDIESPGVDILNGDSTEQSMKSYPIQISTMFKSKPKPNKRQISDIVQLSVITSSPESGFPSSPASKNPNYDSSMSSAPTLSSYPIIPPASPSKNVSVLSSELMDQPNSTSQQTFATSSSPEHSNAKRTTEQLSIRTIKSHPTRLAHQNMLYEQGISPLSPKVTLNSPIKETQNRPSSLNTRSLIDNENSQLIEKNEEPEEKRLETVSNKLKSSISKLARSASSLTNISLLSESQDRSDSQDAGTDNLDLGSNGRPEKIKFGQGSMKKSGSMPRLGENGFKKGAGSSHSLKHGGSKTDIVKND